MLVNDARFVCDVNSGFDSIEVTYTKFIPGLGNKRHTEYITTQPQGNWTELVFQKDSGATYINFLNTMVYKNLEVHRRIAKLSLDLVLEKFSGSYEMIMDNITLLDPTFGPPDINSACTWQRELLRDIAVNTSARVIATCRNKRRLHKYAKTFQTLL